MTTIAKPIWADEKTTSELIDGDNNPVYTRRLAANAALLRSGDSEIGTITGEPFTLGFELTHHANTGTALESDELPVSWLILKDPAAARAIARGLLAAADEWERLTLTLPDLARESTATGKLASEVLDKYAGGVR